MKAIIDKVMAFIDNEMLWLQFGAAIEMLSDDLHDFPDVLAKEIMEELEAAWPSSKGLWRSWEKMEPHPSNIKDYG